jgi:hypothetical protein
VGGTWHLLDELLEEGLDHIRRLCGPETDPGTLDEHVRDQREGERMAVGEIQDFLVLVGGTSRLRRYVWLSSRLRFCRCSGRTILCQPGSTRQLGSGAAREDEEHVLRKLGQ